MDCFRLVRLFVSKCLFLLSMLLIISPVQASNNAFSFVEYNIAFILGLSLPLLLFSALLNRKISIRWGFPLLITFAVIALFYAIAYLTELQSNFALSTSSLLLCLVYLWPFYNQTEKSIITLTEKTRHLFKWFIVSSTGAFNLSIWLLPQFDAYLSWLIFSTIILSLALIRLIPVLKHTEHSAGHLIVQWVFSGFFCAAMYLWLNTKLHVNILAASCVLTYLATLINGCWFLAQYIYQLLAIEPDSQTPVKNTDLFSYTHDPATHLPNFQHALNQSEQYFKQHNHSRYAVVAIKPINFQQVNTVLGHHNSDILLLQLAYCLQQSVADNTLLLNLDNRSDACRLARMPGLNFMAICDLSTNHHPDKTVLDDLCRNLALSVPNAMSFKSFSLNFELAFGIAIAGEHGDTVAELIAHAGDALLAAREHKQQIYYFDNSNTLYTELQLAKMEALKQAIQQEQFTWQVEPQIHHQSKKITGLELNIQWQYQQQQPLLLAEFRALAELSGELYQLTKLMITQAFRILLSVQKQGLLVPVTVNISSKDLLEPDLADFIEQQIHTFSIPGKYLMLALDEAMIVNASSRTKNMIDHLKALDLKIAINDFSGSYEALRYLRKMAINEVKINCSNIVSHVENSTDKAIINTLIHLTRTMNLPLVGTHIDHQPIEQAFIAMGGDYIQGDIIGKSILPNELLTWLKTWFQQYPSIKP